MAAGPGGRLKSHDAVKTYRYLRIGMIGAVVLLTASILIERSKVDCWQTSISAYYYTPVRAIFVGVMIAVGLTLIVYKGRTPWEDGFLNAAGILAPIVAVAPTTDVGDCWSIEPIPLPVVDGSLAPWVVDNIDNNVYALLIAGAIGLLVALLIALLADRKALVKRELRGTIASLVVGFLALFVGWLLVRNWSDFDTRAHGFAAVLMFVFLICAIITKVFDHWHLRKETRWRRWMLFYAALAALMALGGVLIVTTRMFGRHTTFALEAYEIGLFAAYWVAQTKENWDEEVGVTPVGQVPTAM